MKYHLTKFPNGLRLIITPLCETQAVTVLVLVKVGSRYEALNLNGVSHFIEHLMFKGTKKRPGTLALAQELDSVGAEYNAYTSKDHTGYYIKLNAEKVELAIDILSDILFNSKFEAEEINRERGTIIEEINMYEDNPMLFAPAFLEEVMFGKNNSLGQLIIGSKENLKKVNQTQILRYCNQFYNPANMVVSVCGNINVDKIIKLVKKFFNKIYNYAEQNYQKVIHTQTKPQFGLKYKKTEQTQICLGWPGYSYLHPDIEALSVLNVILGANMSSRLFINVRERRGLCYFIRSDLNPYQDIGSFIIQAGLDPSRIKEAIKVILAEIKAIRSQGPKAKELKKAKDYIRGKTILNLENSSEVADWYAAQELLIGKILIPKEKLRLVDKVTNTDVKRVAQDIFQMNKSSLALIGDFPARNAKHFLKLLK